MINGRNELHVTFLFVCDCSVRILIYRRLIKLQNPTHTERRTYPNPRRLDMGTLYADYSNFSSSSSPTWCKYAVRRTRVQPTNQTNSFY